MKLIYSFFISTFLVVTLFMMSCNPTEKPVKAEDANPHSNGFDLEGSDQRAIEIADEVMKAMGGRTNWDETRYVSWNFFGKRHLAWDKWTGDVRLEYPEMDATILVNINNKKGQAIVKGQEKVTVDSVAKYIELGNTIWINDSYWLFMPFKLKDSGVTLKYLGVKNNGAGKPSDVLQLTFKDVGKSPEHKYYVYVDKETRLVSEWAFFNSANDAEPVFNTPWNNYSKHGRILLSDDRGQGRLISEIRVFEHLPEHVFLSLKPVDWKGFEQ